jgi:hypothetical protein
MPKRNFPKKLLSIFTINWIGRRGMMRGMTDLCLGLDLFVSLVRQFQSTDPRPFGMVSIGALLLSASIWLGWVNFPKLWNRACPRGFSYHLLCLAASAVTFFSTLLFFSLPHLRPVVEFSVKTWQVSLESNGELWNKTLNDCRKILEKKGISQTTPNVVTVSYTTTGPGGTVTKNGIKDVSRIFANTILKDFWDKRPMLSLILWARGAEARAAMTESMVEFFDRNPGQVMSSAIVVKVGADKIRENLERQIPKIVSYARGILVLAVVLFQALLLALVFWGSRGFALAGGSPTEKNNLTLARKKRSLRKKTRKISCRSLF